MDSSTDESTTSSEEGLIEAPGLPFRVQLAYGVGHVLNDVCSSIWFTYLLLYLHFVLNFDNSEAGLLLLIGQLADAAANPVIGYLSDRFGGHWIFKYGKRKVYHLIGTVGLLATFPFTFWPCLVGDDIGRMGQMFYYSFFIIIFQISWAAVQISHLSLIPELSINKNDRTKLAAIRYCFTVISNIFVYIVAWGVFGTNNGKQIGPADAFKFQCIVWAGLIFGAVCSFMFHICVKEKNDFENDEDAVTPPQRRSVCEIFSNLQHYQVAVIYMCTMLFLNLAQVYIPLYLQESLGMDADGLAMVPLTVYLGSFVMSLVVEKLNRDFGRKITYVSGTVVGLISCILVLVNSANPTFLTYGVYITAASFGVASAIILVTNLGITADLIGDKTGSGGLIYSLMTICDKLANGFAVFIIQDVHKLYPAKTYYQNVIGSVCGSAIVLACTCVLTLPRPAREKREYIILA